MIRLDVRGNIGDTDWVTLDLTESPDVKLNKEIIDIRNFFERKSDRSQLFTLPFSQINDNFFNYSFELNATFLTFNNRRKADAIIYESGIPVLSGYIKLIKADRVKRLYECVVIGEVGSFGADIKDKRLFTLFDAEDDLDFEMDEENIKLGWEGFMRTREFDTAPGTDLIFCPLVETGVGLNLSLMQQIDQSPVTPSIFYFAIKLKHIIDRIFNQSGYTYTSDFLSTKLVAENGDLYVLFLKDKPLIGDFLKDEISIGVTNQTITQAGGSLPTPTIITTTAASFEIENAGNYTLQIQGNVSRNDMIFCAITMQGSFDNSNWFNIETKTGDRRGGLVSNGINGFFGIPRTRQISTLFLITSGGDGSTSTGSIDFSTTASITADPRTGETFPYYVRFVVNHITNTNFNITLAARMIPTEVEPTSIDVSIRNNIDPDITQGDFMRSVFERFNLYIEQDPSNSRNLIIETYNDFFTADKIHDWTNNIINDDSVEVMPISDLINKRYYFSDSDSDNFLNDLFLKDRGVNYGAKMVTIADDFAQDERRIFSIFEPGTQFQISDNITTIGNYILGDDEQFQTRKARPILINRVQKSLNPNEQFVFNFGTEGVVFTVSTAATFSQLPLTTSGVDNNFALATYNASSLIESRNVLTQDVFSRYWQRFINEISSQDIKVIKCKLQLTPTEYQQFSFRDLIFLIDSYWRVNKISGYSLRDQMATVELIKILSDDLNFPIICDQQPSEILANGKVLFVDSNDNPVQPSQECCTSFGGQWRDLGGGNSICFLGDLPPEGVSLISDLPREFSAFGNTAFSEEANTKVKFNSNEFYNLPASGVFTITGTAVFTSGVLESGSPFYFAYTFTASVFVTTSNFHSGTIAITSGAPVSDDNVLNLNIINEGIEIEVGTTEIGRSGFVNVRLDIINNN